MSSSKSIWDLVGLTPSGIVQDILGYVLGWALTLVILAIPLAILYFILKKLGYTRYWKPPKAAPGIEVEWSNMEGAVTPTAQASAPAEPTPDVPAWQREMIEQWQQEEDAKRQKLTDTLGTQRKALLGIYRILVYVVVSVLIAGGLFFGVLAVWKKNPQLYIVTIVLLAAAAGAYSQWNPSQYE